MISIRFVNYPYSTRCKMKTLKLLAVLMLVLFLFSCKKPITELIQLEDPIFNPEEGTYYSGQAIQLTCPEYGASIHYTTDGSEPDNQSALYTAPLIIPDVFPGEAITATIKARAYKDGFDPSNVVSSTYIVNFFNTVTTPTFNPAQGDITTETEISIHCSTLNVEVHYTLDGSEPSQTSALYTEGFAIQQTGQVTLKARGFRSGWNASEIAQTTYNVSAP